MPNAFHRNHGGFTLLEVLLSVLIGSSLVVMATLFVFSLGELWGQGSTERLLQQHAQGVTRFLEQSLRNAVPTESEPGADILPVFWYRPAGNAFTGSWYLTFLARHSPPVLVWPDRPLPQVMCSLRLDPQDGLVLLWKSRLELRYGEEEPRASVLSPFVTRLEFLYLDREGGPGGWEVLETPPAAPGRTPPMPVRLRLTFTYENELIERELALPGAPVAVSIF